VVARFDGHLDADVVPPVEARSDRQDDPVLWRWFVRTRRHQQPRAPDTIGIEFLDHYTVEEWSQLVTHNARPLLIIRRAPDRLDCPHMVGPPRRLASYA
jgi:hypothetical protein